MNGGNLLKMGSESKKVSSQACTTLSSSLYIPSRKHNFLLLKSNKTVNEKSLQLSQNTEPSLSSHEPSFKQLLPTSS